jgi:hypothetical protein
MSQIPDELRDLASRVNALQEQVSSLGLFLGDRELLECLNPQRRAALSWSLRLTRR